MTATSLTEFLRAQLAADEAAALAVMERAEEGFGFASIDAQTSENFELMLRGRPERVLADVKAKRAVVAELKAMSRWSPGSTESNSADHMLRALAQPYSRAVGWQEAWGE